MVFLDSLIEVAPTLTVLQDSSRFLLTLGMGLFVAYMIFMVTANILGILYRFIIRLTKRNKPTEVVPIRQEAS